MTATTPSPKVKLTFKTGGWVLLLSAVVTVLAVVLTLYPRWSGQGHRQLGDGKDITTYGFDLSNFSGNRAYLVASGTGRDALRAMDNPPVLTLAETLEQSRGRGKYLVDDDLVIGVEVAGMARAYPLRLLQLHEVINDTLGELPIVVTYHAISGTSTVQKREIGQQIFTFGFSGLIYQSCLLMYNHAPPGKESLWSPLQRSALSGPALGQELPPLPYRVVPWSYWRNLQPTTTVVAREEGLRAEYSRDRYQAYFAHDEVPYPVAMPETKSSWPLKTVVMALENAPRNYVLIPLDAYSSGTQPEQTYPLKVAGLQYQIRVWPRLHAAEVTDVSGTLVPSIRSMNFAMSAFYGAHTIWQPEMSHPGMLR
jgi:hypothetical protein